jgi:hypothetical protein
MPGLESTSIARERGQASEPSTESVVRAAAAFAVALAESLEAPLRGRPGPAGPAVAGLADPGAARTALEMLLAERLPAVAAAGPG